MVTAEDIELVPLFARLDLDTQIQLARSAADVRLQLGQSAESTSLAVRSPERTAPSM